MSVDEEWIGQDHLHHVPVVCRSFLDSVWNSGSASLLEVFTVFPEWFWLRSQEVIGASGDNITKEEEWNRQSEICCFH